MIQRIQTVYMLLVVVIAVMMQFPGATLLEFVLSSGNGTQSICRLSFTGLSIAGEEAAPLQLGNSGLAYVICGFVALISIFLFRRLSLQLRLLSYNLIFILLALFYTGYNIYKLQHVEGTVVQGVSFNWALLLPLLMTVFNLLAVKGVRRDIELLASADRLR